MRFLARCCLSAIVLILYPSAALCCTPEEYPWTIRGVRGCCRNCPAGHYLVSRCVNFNEDPVCAECPTGKYTSRWNAHSSCASCKICSEGAKYKKKCEKNSDAECSCGKGKQLIKESNSCEPCPSRSYSDEEGINPCKPWTRCKEIGQHLIKNGSSTEDVECGVPIVTPKTTTTQGRSFVNPTTVPRTTIPSGSTKPSPSVTTASQPAMAVEVKFYIGVIVVAALIFLIVLIKRRKMYLEVKKQDFYWCLAMKKDMKGPVQEVSEDITSVQV
ncbi:tumor necrosis factor receptor superfamily member 4 [Rhincodon typus]|uniref:tumor necrosis factor receptor superfamily member 4 n=1 Tax=Rhincodon typus TaxID=259920 RepID=UPI00202EF798|nr:tumor necrosis factor receptor superfamily member 4 [Rhincodon typus]